MLEHIDISKLRPFDKYRDFCPKRENDYSYPGAVVSGYVYFIGKIGDVKIGMAMNFYFRIGQISQEMSYVPEIFHLIYSENMRRLESRFHGYYQEKNIHHEWFNLSREDIEYVKTISEQNIIELLKAPESELPF